MISRFFGLAAMIGCLAVVYLFESQSLFTGHMRIFHWPAVVLTLFGPMALVSVCSEWRSVWTTIGLVLGASARKKQKRFEKEAMLLHKLSKEYYTEGPDVFEKFKEANISEFLQHVFQRLATRMPIYDVRDFLEIERDRRQVRIIQAMQVMGLGVRLTPSVGMLGTILGMVQLLSSLSDPAQIGNSMSLALLTTFYGLFFSLAVWTPMQQKIEHVLDVEIEGYNQAIRWIELLENRKPSNYFADSVDVPGAKEARSKEAA